MVLRHEAPGTARLNELLASSRERIYRALKDHDPQVFSDAIRSAEAVSLNHNLPHKVAVDIEAAVVLSVAQALRLKP